MSAEIVPFPIASRIDLVQSVARRMLELPPDRAERHLEFSADRQAMVLRRRGIVRAVIDREIAAFVAAVRAEVWHRVLSPQEVR
jgi:hypothetical protein